MKRDFRQIKEIADRLEIRPKKGENLGEFIIRVTEAHLEESGSPLAALELVLGKRWDRFNDFENHLALMFQASYSREEKARYEMLNDTHFGMTWKEYEEILKGVKFEKVFSYIFDDCRDPEIKEEYAIWARRDKGFLLTAESYDNRRVINNTKLYFELSTLIDGREPDEVERIELDRLMKGSCGPCLDENRREVAQAMSYIAIEGLVGSLQMLEESRFQTNNPWQFPENQFLWLCDYTETKDKGYDSKAIAERKLAQLPEDVQAMIGYHKKE